MVFQKAVTSLGLVLDIVGVLMLWRFGLPENVDRKGDEYWITGNKHPDEIAKAKKYDRLSLAAICLIVIGFILQITSQFL